MDDALKTDKAYNDVLHHKLKPKLNLMLQMICLRKPSDPIAYLANHIRHLDFDGNEIRVVNCEECESAKKQVVQNRIASAKASNATLLTAVASSEASTMLSESDKQLIQKCQAESWFSTGEWQKVLIIDCWSDLTKKYGKELKWWHAASAMKSKKIPQIPPLVNRKVWKTVRVFVSSTFKDMFCEREWLVKRVFPQLRTWCAERKLFLVECDLRWGMPKDSTSREILAACLNEIDRCRQENTMTYFVGLLGERYGWVPTEKEFPEDLRRSYCWMPGISVTTLEMLTGVLWDNNPNAIMLIRDDAFSKKTDSLLATLPDDSKKSVISSYRESEESNKQSLDMLHKLVRAWLPPAQVYTYPADVDGLMSDGSNRINISGLQQFGERVLQHLQKTIEAQYQSLSTDQLSAMEVQHGEHEQFMVQRSRVLFGRDAELSQIQKYIDDDSKTNVPVLNVSGSAGTGKSSIVARVAQQCSQNPANKVVVHFVGATASSTTLYRVLRRLWFECLDTPEANIPTDMEELKRCLDSVFRRASVRTEQAGLKKLVIFIDALNQMDDDGEALNLVWLPKAVPHNVRVVVSTLEGNTLDALRAAKLPEVQVKALDVDWRKQVVVQYLKDFNKKLSDAQLAQLVKHSESGRPLWLTLACEELRVFGTFEFLDKKIASLVGTSDLFGLIGHIVERVISETVVGGDLMQAALSLIAVSRFGLTETELVEMLVMEPTLPSWGKLDCVKTEHEALPKDIEKLPMHIWAVLNLDLRQFLRPVGSAGDGRLDFYHRSISKVVQSMMFPQKEQPREPVKRRGIFTGERPPVFVKTFWQQRVSQYFQQRSASYKRMMEELPHHLIETDEKWVLGKLLSNPLVFEYMYKEETKPQLLAHCRAIGTYKDASERYQNASEKWRNKLVGKHLSVSEETNKIMSRMGRRLDYATKVKGFSSQYEKDSWKRILGGHQVYPYYKLSPEAWAPRSGGNKEFVELQYPEAAYITGVAIYETFNAGAVTKISVRNEQNQWDTLYSGKAEWLQYARAFCPEITKTKYKADTIRLDIDASVCNGLVQIDAVELFGFTDEEYMEEHEKKLKSKMLKRKRNEELDSKTKSSLVKQWVDRILSFSTQSSEEEGAATQLLGRRRTYPENRNYGNAWCPKSYDRYDANREDFIEFAFKQPVYLWEVVIYETMHPGGVKRLLVKDEQGAWQTVYEAEYLQKFYNPRKFRPTLNRPRFKVDTFRMEVSQACAENEINIDAVKIYGYNTLQELEKAEKDEQGEFEKKGGIFEQFASKVISFSSENGTSNYSHKNILHAPPCKRDNNTCWSPKWSKVPTEEFIELEYSKAVYITSIVVYELCCVGGITKISAKHDTNGWVPIYEGKADHLYVRGVCGRSFRPRITQPDFKTNMIRLDITTGEVQTEYESCNYTAVAIYGSENLPKGLVKQSIQATKSSVQPKKQAGQSNAIKDTKLIKQWINSIAEYTCDGGDETPMHVLGDPNQFPLYGHNPDWTPPQNASKYSFEFSYDKPVFVASLEIYETYHAGGVSRIDVRDPQGQWQTIYTAQAIQDIAQSRKFVPKITRPKFKANEFRIEVSHAEAAPEWVELDAIALYGLEDECPPDDDSMMDVADSAGDETETEEQKEKRISEYMSIVWSLNNIPEQKNALVNVKNTTFGKWLRVLIKLGWFYIDLGDYEIAEEHLKKLSYTIEMRHATQGYNKSSLEIIRLDAEIQYALVVLYRTLTTKFTSADAEFAKKSKHLGPEKSSDCYELNSRCWTTEDQRFGEMATACSFFLPELRDSTIKLLEHRKDFGGLVDLYALKGVENQSADISVAREYHEKAIKLAVSEFGQIHLLTARAHQLYGQTLLHRYSTIPAEKKNELLNESYNHYAEELQIIETLFGVSHAFAERSREDNITLLIKLGKKEEAKNLRQKQQK